MLFWSPIKGNAILTSHHVQLIDGFAPQKIKFSFPSPPPKKAVFLCERSLCCSTLFLECFRISYGIFHLIITGIERRLGLFFDSHPTLTLKLPSLSIVPTLKKALGRIPNGLFPQDLIEIYLILNDLESADHGEKIILWKTGYFHTSLDHFISVKIPHYFDENFINSLLSFAEVGRWGGERKTRFRPVEIRHASVCYGAAIRIVEVVHVCLDCLPCFYNNRFCTVSSQSLRIRLASISLRASSKGRVSEILPRPRKLLFFQLNEISIFQVW